MVFHPYAWTAQPLVLARKDKPDKRSDVVTNQATLAPTDAAPFSVIRSNNRGAIFFAA